MFKLNKLRASQESSAAPSPSLSSLASPNTASPAPPRHAHSLSLAPPAQFVHSGPYHPAAAFNPFGPGAVLGGDALSERALGFGLGANGNGRDESAMSDPGAPTDQSLAPPPPPARADSRPDFARGFGLDAPMEEEEPPEDEEAREEMPEEADDDEDVRRGFGFGIEGVPHQFALEEEKPHRGFGFEFESVDAEEEEEEDGVADASRAVAVGDADDLETDMELDDAEGGTIAAASRMHSRHMSRLSAALSLRSVGGTQGVLVERREDDGEGEHDEDAVGEWTGSEDLRTAESSADEVRGARRGTGMRQLTIARTRMAQPRARSMNGRTRPTRSARGRSARSVGAGRSASRAACHTFRTRRRSTRPCSTRATTQATTSTSRIRAIIRATTSTSRIHATIRATPRARRTTTMSCRIRLRRAMARAICMRGR
jgi:hypothetical protein